VFELAPQSLTQIHRFSLLPCAQEARSECPLERTDVCLSLVACLESAFSSPRAQIYPKRPPCVDYAQQSEHSGSIEQNGVSRKIHFVPQFHNCAHDEIAPCHTSTVTAHCSCLSGRVA
jgi:hypothetical protein